MNFLDVDKYKEDKRVVITLDAGGTNFSFSAVKKGGFAVSTSVMPSKGHDLSLCLGTIKNGIEKIGSELEQKPSAISLGFPGPADYKEGVVFELVNLPAFKDPFPLKAFLEENFKVPVFMNNDADLFTLGEFVYGLTKNVNLEFEKRGVKKRTQNLLGVTLGTGFGGGAITQGNLFLGDNCAQGEINRLRNKYFANSCAEDSVSSRGIRKYFAEEAEIDFEKSPAVEEIAFFAQNKNGRYHLSAKKAFEKFALALADSLADAVSLFDGLVVIGGGISGSHDVFLKKLVREMNKPYESVHGGKIPRTETRVFNLEDPDEFEEYFTSETIKLQIPGSKKFLNYEYIRSNGVGISKLGTEKASALGAYIFAVAAMG
ncbi:ROK family protein [candidate division WOR-3 bacterium]|nr:ROK family protein [candidate division WOR-3 bacterium]